MATALGTTFTSAAARPHRVSNREVISGGSLHQCAPTTTTLRPMRTLNVTRTSSRLVGSCPAAAKGVTVTELDRGVIFFQFDGDDDSDEAAKATLKAAELMYDAMGQKSAASGETVAPAAAARTADDDAKVTQENENTEQHDLKTEAKVDEAAEAVKEQVVADVEQKEVTAAAEEVIAAAQQVAAAQEAAQKAEKIAAAAEEAAAAEQKAEKATAAAQQAAAQKAKEAAAAEQAAAAEKIAAAQQAASQTAEEVAAGEQAAQKAEATAAAEKIAAAEEAAAQKDEKVTAAAQQAARKAEDEKRRMENLADLARRTVEDLEAAADDDFFSEEELQVLEKAAADAVSRLEAAQQLNQQIRHAM